MSDQAVLLTGATLLGLLALASVAVLVGSRLAEGTRRVGLLKAVGGTPDLVAATFLIENLFLALVAAAVGLSAGWLAAPLFSKPEANLVGTAGAPPLTLVAVVVTLGAALAVALASTFVPAIRAARMSTVSALADAPRLPRRRESLVRLSRKLPVPALFGLRLVARRPRRAILSAASIAVTVMGLVAALAIHAGVDRKFSHFGSSGGLVNPDIPRAEQVLTVLTILLVTLAVLTAIFTTLGDGPRRETRLGRDAGAGCNPAASPGRAGHDAGHPRATRRDPRPPTRPRPVRGRGSTWREWPAASALAGRRGARNRGRRGRADQCSGPDRPPATGR